MSFYTFIHDMHETAERIFSQFNIISNFKRRLKRLIIRAASFGTCARTLLGGGGCVTRAMIYNHIYTAYNRVLRFGCTTTTTTLFRSAGGLCTKQRKERGPFIYILS